MNSPPWLPFSFFVFGGDNGSLDDPSFDGNIPSVVVWDDQMSSSSPLDPVKRKRLTLARQGHLASS